MLSGFNALRDKFRRISGKATDILSTRVAARFVLRMCRHGVGCFQFEFRFVYKY